MNGHSWLVVCFAQSGFPARWLEAERNTSATRDEIQRGKSPLESALLNLCGSFENIVPREAILGTKIRFLVRQIPRRAAASPCRPLRAHRGVSPAWHKRESRGIADLFGLEKPFKTIRSNQEMETGGGGCQSQGSEALVR